RNRCYGVVFGGQTLTDSIAQHTRLRHVVMRSRALSKELSLLRKVMVPPRVIAVAVITIRLVADVVVQDPRQVRRWQVCIQFLRDWAYGRWAQPVIRNRRTGARIRTA